MPTSNIINGFMQRALNNLHPTMGAAGASTPLSSLRQMALKYKAYLTGQSSKQLDIATAFSQLICGIDDDYSIANIAAMNYESSLLLDGDALVTFVETLQQYTCDATSIVPKMDPLSQQVLCVTSTGYGIVLDFYTRQLAPTPAGERVYRTYLYATPYLDNNGVTTPTETRLLARRDAYDNENQDVYSSIFPAAISDLIGGFSIFEFAYEQMGNYEVSSALTEVIDTLLSGQISSTWIQTKLNAAMDHNKIVVSLFQSVATGFRTGGLKGAFMTIYHWANSGATFSTDSEGMYTFTDNSDFIPKTYMASLVTGIIAGVTTVASIIASVFAPAIAPVLSAISGIAWSIIGSFHYDAARTNASIVDTEDAILPWCPLAAFQGFFDVTPNSELVYALDSGVGLIAVEVPFGYLLISRREKQQPGQLAKLKGEFHPSLYDYRAAANEVFRNFWVKLDHVQEIWVSRSATELNTTNMFSFVRRVLDIGASETMLMNNENGSLSDSDDRTVRKIIATNVALGTLYLYAFVSGDDSRTVLEIVNVRALGAWLPCGDGPDYDPVTDYSEWAFDEYFAVNLVYGCLGTENQSWESLIRNIPMVAYDYGTTSNPCEYTWMDYVLGIVSVDQYSDWIKPLCGDYLQLLPETPFGIQLPAYNKASFWFAIGITVVALVVTTIVAVTASVKVKKYVNNVRAKQAANTERAWNNLVSNPTMQNAEAYRRSARKANLLSKFFGGTTFSTENYWGGGSNAGTTGAVSSYMYGLLADEEQNLSAEQIIKLIAG